MSNEASQEMTLQQWVDRLGPNHRASKELLELQQQAKEHVTELQERCNELLSERRGIRYLVHDFHTKFGYPVHTVPHVPAPAAVRFRLKLISEEFFELLDATLGEYSVEPWQRQSAEAKVKGLIDRAPVVVDMLELTDAMADLDYVVEGTRLTFGIDG